MRRCLKTSSPKVQPKGGAQGVFLPSCMTYIWSKGDVGQCSASLSLIQAPHLLPNKISAACFLCDSESPNRKSCRTMPSRVPITTLTATTDKPDLLLEDPDHTSWCPSSSIHLATNFHLWFCRWTGGVCRGGVGGGGQLIGKRCHKDSQC